MDRNIHIISIGIKSTRFRFFVGFSVCLVSIRQRFSSSYYYYCYYYCVLRKQIDNIYIDIIHAPAGMWRARAITARNSRSLNGTEQTYLMYEVVY